MPYYQSLLVCYISQSFLISHDLGSLEEYWPSIWQNVPPLSDVFPMTWLGLWVWRKTHRGEKVFSSHIRYICSQYNVTDDANLGYLNSTAFARFLYCNVTVFLHFIFCSWKQVSKSSPRSSSTPLLGTGEITYLEFHYKKHCRQIVLTTVRLFSSVNSIPLSWGKTWYACSMKYSTQIMPMTRLNIFFATDYKI